VKFWLFLPCLSVLLHLLMGAALSTAALRFRRPSITTFPSAGNTGGAVWFNQP